MVYIKFRWYVTWVVWLLAGCLNVLVAGILAVSACTVLVIGRGYSQACTNSLGKTTHHLAVRCLKTESTYVRSCRMSTDPLRW